MSCFGGCGKEKPKNLTEIRVIYKPADTVVVETQTSKHAASEESHHHVLVIDCGSTKIRAGFAGEERPLFTIPTVVGKTTVQDESKKIFGAAALRSGISGKITYPMEKGLIKDWNDMEDFFEHIIEYNMRIKPKMHQIMITEPYNNTKVNKEKTAEIMFEKFQFNSFFLAPSTQMAMYGYGCTTGVMVESGAAQTHILAFKNGDYIPESYRHIPLGGNDLSKYMGQLLIKNGKAQSFLGQPYENEILNEIKCNESHIVLDYDEKIKKYQLNPDSVTHNAMLRNGATVTMETEGYQVAELLFKPEIIGLETGGVQKKIFECIESCEVDLKKNLYANICLCGGNTMFNGIKDRLQWEVRTYAGPNVRVNVNVQPDRENVVFLGTALLGVCSKMSDCLISLHEYKEYGGQIVHVKTF